MFLDEIQDCPQALKALRYFAEEMPELHVIAAGSLLEFVLEDKQFSFPVGRVQLMNLGPRILPQDHILKRNGGNRPFSISTL